VAHHFGHEVHTRGGGHGRPAIVRARAVNRAALAAWPRASTSAAHRSRRRSTRARLSPRPLQLGPQCSRGRPPSPAAPGSEPAVSPHRSDIRPRPPVTAKNAELRNMARASPPSLLDHRGFPPCGCFSLSAFLSAQTHEGYRARLASPVPQCTRDCDTTSQGRHSGREATGDREASRRSSRPRGSRASAHPFSTFRPDSGWARPFRVNDFVDRVGGPWTGHLTKPAQVCFCNEGWICEAHPDQPHQHDGVRPCNPDDPPRMPDGWQSKT
jgi:hypothetical protein